MGCSHRTCGAAAVVSAALTGVSGGQIDFTEASQLLGVQVSHDPSTTFTISQFDISPMTAGGAVGDFNNDGWQDLFVLTGGGGPDFLFLNDQNGGFVDQAAEWGIADPHMGLGATVGDYNDDGWLDIFITSVGPGPEFPSIGHHRLYRNDGGTGFTNVAAEAGVEEISTVFPDGFGAAFGDYDLDGDLDLFTTGWITNSGGNSLLRNDGGVFTNVTVSAGLFPALSGVRGFSPIFADMNGDRYPELLIAADFGTSRYFINDGDGTFTHFTGPSGTGLDGNGMGQAVADLNRDGLPDWYVTSIFSLDSGLVGVPGTGNMMYQNNGGHTYLELSEGTLTKDGGWGWGVVAVDIDHDGWLDLLETNGWSQPNQGQPEWLGEQSYVWRNNGGGPYSEISGDCNFVHDQLGRGMVSFDLENDGDQDMAVFSFNDALKIYRNEHDLANGAYLRVFLDTSADPALAPDGYGTHLVATVAGTEHHRWIFGGSQYLTTSELSAHWGLAGASKVDELRIEWTDGSVTVMADVPVNQTLTIPAPAPVTGDATGDGLVNVEDVIAVILAWDTSNPAADLNGDGIVNVQDLVIVLLNWS